jgi:hypothetical protein
MAELRGYFHPEGKPIRSGGMATTTTTQLAKSATHRGYEQLAGSVGALHERKARNYAPGSRSHEFFSGSSQYNYDLADVHFWAQKKNVGMKAEPVQPRGRELRNYGGKYN